MGTDAVAEDPNEARAWLNDVGRLRASTRRVRLDYWFPVLLFGVLVLAATPLYALHSRGSSDFRYVTEFPDYLPGGNFLGNPTAVALYWLIGIPVAYLLTAGFYWLRARRRGIATSSRSFVLVGIGLLALLVLNALQETGKISFGIAVWLPGDLTVRGLLPLIVVALAFSVLARAERSIGLLLFAASFLALVIVANLYDLENLTYRMGWGAAGPEVNVLVVGGFLTLGGIGFALWAALLKRRQT
ncbi:MAG: hypothetical protein ACR2P2_03515 [Nakamurella sp.]